MRKIILVLAALGLTSGVAAADRWHGESRGGWHGPVRVEGRGSWGGGVRVTPTPSYRYYNRGWSGHVYVQPHYVRRPIYVRAPVIRYHYYDYYRRPAVIVENYAPMDGYTWVPGQWNWNGYEWIWQPGHYEPIAPSATVYGDGGYYDGY